MVTINEQLYHYMLQHLTCITDEWLAKRRQVAGSIYSSDAHVDTEALLRKQNQMTNETIATLLIEDYAIFKEKKDQWAIEVAQSRMNSGTPIYEVLYALQDAREVFWTYIEKFSKKEHQKVTIEHVLEWGRLIHKGFDDLCGAFAQHYYYIVKQRLNDQQQLIHELSAPIIPISETRAILPLIGDIDTVRAKMIVENIPHDCMELGVTQLFIDLSGVAIIDTMVAQQLFQLTSVLTLLGISAVITGIRPEIAQTSVHLGLDFSIVSTYSTLKRALTDL
ncbi:YetI protein [Fictibacillus macauensis ZFHKF-1]|uniref:YetI protein n=1 Tax=Fictibacillus macauensis ZFHKF-1 TaxID=1196324 RepID=I8UIR8_9BACL|nr:STAS domain-containing protein [Fictibacillus macauensis]EIT86728.1 YetI protein [Fictibacillus macauensis ZFHKF-1]